MEETKLSFRDNPFKHEGKPTSDFLIGTFCGAPKLLGIKQGILFLMLQLRFSSCWGLQSTLRLSMKILKWSFSIPSEFYQIFMPQRTVNMLESQE